MSPRGETTGGLLASRNRIAGAFRSAFDDADKRLWPAMRIYLESTIPSYLVARPARDLLQAARQQLTRDWWELKRGQHELFSSQVVLDEVAAGEATMARRRLKLLRDIPLLELSAAANRLGRDILLSGLLPVSADGDAAHIAVATVHRMDILLTWNCRHIANVALQHRLRRLVEGKGFNLPALATPEEFMGDL
jgi:hypothetical protein